MEPKDLEKSEKERTNKVNANTKTYNTRRRHGLGQGTQTATTVVGEKTLKSAKNVHTLDISLESE